MSEQNETGDAGDGGWEIPTDRIRFAFYVAFGLWYVIVSVLDMWLKTRLTDDHRHRVWGGIALPLTALTLIVAWRISGIFWPMRRLGPGEAPPPLR